MAELRAPLASLAVSLMVAVFAAVPAPSCAGALPPLDDPSTPATISEPAMVTVGSTVPDFAYASTPYGWRYLHHLCASGGLVIVVDPTDADLIALERDRLAYEERNVTPVAVVRANDREAWRTVTRLQLRFSVLSDPHGVIAEALGLTPSAPARAGATWVVMDQARRVRASGLGSVADAGFFDQVAGAHAAPSGSATAQNERPTN
jgi:peroxiredoxin